MSAVYFSDGLRTETSVIGRLWIDEFSEQRTRTAVACEFCHDLTGVRVRCSMSEREVIRAGSAAAVELIWEAKRLEAIRRLELKITAIAKRN